MRLLKSMFVVELRNGGLYLTTGMCVLYVYRHCVYDLCFQYRA